MSEQPFHLLYRPQRFGDVIGQASTVRSLKSLLEGTSVPHSFLFTGPSGVGKTTLARILAKAIKIPSRSVLEIDAATYSGIDDMRLIKSHMEVQAFGKNNKKLLILDECHSLSKQAWQSWLKIIEEPPEHLYIAFCTTEPPKVPKTIKTRCHAFDLKPVPQKLIIELLAKVTEAEGLGVYEDAFRMIANKADGSVRQALVYLSMCRDCTSKKQVQAVLEEVTADDKQVWQLCKAVSENVSFLVFRDLVKKLDVTNMEGVRIQICHYLTKVLLDTRNKEHVEYLVAVLDAFSEPFDPTLKKAPLLVAYGQVVYG